MKIAGITGKFFFQDYNEHVVAEQEGNSHEVITVKIFLGLLFGALSSCKNIN